MNKLWLEYYQEDSLFIQEFWISERDFNSQSDYLTQLDYLTAVGLFESAWMVFKHEEHKDEYF